MYVDLAVLDMHNKFLVHEEKQQNSLFLMCTSDLEAAADYMPHFIVRLIT